MNNAIVHEERLRIELCEMFQQVDESLHGLLDYLDPATPDFDTNTAISHWERFAGLQQRHSLTIASRLADMTDTPDVDVTPDPDTLSTVTL
jgi:hypothetical protein